VQSPCLGWNDSPSRFGSQSEAKSMRVRESRWPLAWQNHAKADHPPNQLFWVLDKASFWRS